MAAKLGSAPRLLVLRTDKIGDVLTATPILRSIKERFPLSHVTAWIGEGTSSVLRDNSDVDDFQEHPRDLAHSQIFSCAVAMRRARFDGVLFLKESCGNYAIAAMLAGIPLRAAGASKWYRRIMTANKPHSWDDDPTHIVERSYEVAEAAFGEAFPRRAMRFVVKPEAEDRACGMTPASPYVVIHPMTGGSARPWLPELYAHVGRMLHERLDCMIVVTGLAKEAGTVAEVVRGIGRPAIDLAGKTDLGTLAAVLGRASVMVAGSTGALHLAASQGTPVVMVEPTPDAAMRGRQWHPWMVPYELCCATKVCDACADGCRFRSIECCRSISPEDVVEKAARLAVRGSR